MVPAMLLLLSLDNFGPLLIGGKIVTLNSLLLLTYIEQIVSMRRAHLHLYL